MPANVKLTVDIYCGAYVQAVPGYEFYCYDYLTGLYHYCIGRNDWQYQCWDGAEWEWGNFNERDGTVDNSLLTSLETDGLAGTSASILVENNFYSENSPMAMAHGPAIYETSVVTSCDELEVEDYNESVEDDFGYYGKSKMTTVKYHQHDEHDYRFHGENDYDVKKTSHHH